MAKMVKGRGRPPIGKRPMTVAERQRRHRDGAASPLQDIVRGDVPLARAIFGDQSLRKLIPRLQREGWPIFILAGKRCARAADLKAHAQKIKHRPKSKR